MKLSLKVLDISVVQLDVALSLAGVNFWPALYRLQVAEVGLYVHQYQTAVTDLGAIFHFSSVNRLYF